MLNRVLETENGQVESFQVPTHLNHPPQIYRVRM